MKNAALVILLLAGSGSTASAQDLVSVEDREARLDTWLSMWGGSAESARLWAGGVGIAGAGIVAALGIWQWDQSPEMRPLWGTGFGVAILELALAVAQLAVPSPQELRLARFRAAQREGALDPEELAAFEGEIRAEAEAAAQMRRIMLGIGLGLVAAGGVGLGLTAALGQNVEEWVWGYTLSGLGMLIGTVTAIISPFETPIEQEWAAYRRGFAPATSVSVAPVVGPDVIGLAAHGSF